MSILYACNGRKCGLGAIEVDNGLPRKTHIVSPRRCIGAATAAGQLRPGHDAAKAFRTPTNDHSHVAAPIRRGCRAISSMPACYSAAWICLTWIEATSNGMTRCCSANCKACARCAAASRSAGGTSRMTSTTAVGISGGCIARIPQGWSGSAPCTKRRTRRALICRVLAVCRLTYQTEL